MKAEEASSDLERLRALFAAERSANFPEFALPLTALGLRAVYRRDADAFVMYTFLQLGLVLALCFLSVASLTIAANGRVSATVRFHRASVGCACLVQLLTSSATTYSSFGVHALFGA